MSAVVAARADTVVVDIEGTTSAADYVFGTLYPYSRARLARWVHERADHPDVRRAVAGVRVLTGRPEASGADVVAQLTGWLDADEKATPLKTLQGLIWAAGFAAGELVSHLYPDVAPALRAWSRAGARLYVYSSGSVPAQRAWFGHTPAGDLTALFSGYFDTENAGPKRMPDSYRAIAAAIGTPAERTLFLSDLVDELDAARAAGWQTIGVCRPGEPNEERGVGTHPRVTSFDQISLTDVGGVVPPASRQRPARPRRTR